MINQLFGTIIVFLKEKHFCILEYEHFVPSCSGNLFGDVWTFCCQVCTTYRLLFAFIKLSRLRDSFPVFALSALKSRFPGDRPLLCFLQGFVIRMFLRSLIYDTVTGCTNCDFLHQNFVREINSSIFML